MKNTAPIGYYPFLDGFRGIASIIVLIAHCSIFFETYKLSGLFFSIVTFLGPIGHLGIDMFFVISGFLISGILIPDFHKEVDIIRFYKRRFLKIVPQYYIVIFVTIGLSSILLNIARSVTVVNEPFHAAKILGYFFFIQNFYAEPFRLLSHTWSLAVEEHFYLIYPLVIYAVFRSTADGHGRRKALLATLITFVGGIILFRDIINHQPIAAVVSNHTTLYRIDAIMFGCILKLTEPYYAKGQDRLWAFLSPLLFILGCSIYYYFTTVADSHGVILCRGKHLFAYLAASAIFLASYRAGAALKALFQNRQLIWLGQNSYAIYLWHYPLIFFFVILSPMIGTAISMGLYVSTAIFAGFLSTKFIEKKFLSLRNRFCP